MSKQKNTPTKQRHYFFLNPYEDCAFTSCPKCNTKTKVRKFPLVIHIEPNTLFVLNKNCKYCPTCDLIIVKKAEIENLMSAQFEQVNPTVIGNEYLVFGTLDKKDWQKNKTVTMNTGETMEKAYVFKDVLKFEMGERWVNEE